MTERLIEKLEEARAEAQRLMEAEDADYGIAADVRDLIERALERARAACSICNQEFDPAKKHLCDGCGSTFTPGPATPQQTSQEILLREYQAEIGRLHDAYERVRPEVKPR